MKNLAQLVAKVADTKYEVTNGKVKQTERNALKKAIVDAILDDLYADGYEIFRTNDGAVLKLATATAVVKIPVALDAVVKNLDYDFDFEIDEYELKLAKQAEREQARAEKAKANTKK